VGDSSSSTSEGNASEASPPDLRDFVGIRQGHWSQEMMDKYNKRYGALNKVIQKCHKAKKRSLQAKEGENLGVYPCTWNSKGPQRFVPDVKIELDYFRDSLLKESEKVSLVIPLLKDTTDKWYKAIYTHINHAEPKRQGIKFDHQK